MGVPVFFKWLSMRNPKILIDAKQPDEQQFNSGNPAIDNFYVDMNGLIHPSVNPKGQNIKTPKDFEEQCQNIFAYMDKIMNIVRPNKFLYLAIDGVAPRAKMNQQRSRRFRAAMEGQQSKKQKQRLLQEYKRMEIVNYQIQQYVTKESFDSNLITPGTRFLSDVSDRIRAYVKKKLSTDRLWKNLTVVFSDANCPGEGQHKIMDFIRQERASPHYNPNQSHCIYGADADLIMLALATHQPRFFIIRQIVITANDKWCTTCGKKGHYFTDCAIADSIQNQQKVQQKMNADAIGISFQFIKIKAVRQFIHVTYENCTFSKDFSFDLERVIDDFVFLCFFVGNDFLPHIPCLSIRQGGIDVLMRVYQQCLKLMPDYITHVGHLNMKSLKIFLKQLSSYQPELVGQLINKQAYQKQRQNFQKNIRPGIVKNLEQNPQNKKNKKDDEYESNIDPHDLLGSFKQQIKKRITPDLNLDDYSAFNHQIYNYKEKYYSEKFRIQPKEFLQLKNNISKKYIEALQWICRYYYETVPSWDWFYPFHYSPFLTDIQVPQHNPIFEVGKPFKPYQQLMGVLPPKTYAALPSGLHPLMLDKNSPICDYFPQSFVIDVVGKKFAWLGQVLLPFIDSNRLLTAMGDYQTLLTAQERRLNKLGTNNIYISKYGTLGRHLSNTQNLQLGQKIILSNQDHNICGEAILLMQYNDTTTFQFYFYQPWGLKHDVKLKQGIQYNPLEQIDQDFVSRTDKRSFGGERFVRVVERSLGRKIQVERKKMAFSGRRTLLEQREQTLDRQPRQRSREQYNKRPNQYQNNSRGNDNYNRNNYSRDNNYNSNDNRSRDNRSGNYQNNNGQYQQRNYTNSNNNYQSAYNNNQGTNNNRYQGYNNNNSSYNNNNSSYNNNNRTYQNNYNNNPNYNNNNNRRNYQMGPYGQQQQGQNNVGEGGSSYNNTSQTNQYNSSGNNNNNKRNPQY